MENSHEDMLFLLSIEEVVKYFGDSGQLKNPKQLEPNDAYYHGGCRLSDQFNNNRKAGDDWWLRSPGNDETHPAFVAYDGTIVSSVGSVGFHTSGNHGEKKGVRPAFWLKL